ncbi:YceI family protein [Thiobacillus sp.]|uniref:YceI family protein n=1 Tax=Thiobacillus sp. TaxID=924 RepID=UPI0011D48E08|nr:YceI family protein [Thiobacillus sp.]TXH75238.1 MAG: YceI family protein [Thiobacillus sp.]
MYRKKILTFLSSAAAVITLLSCTVISPTSPTSGASLTPGDRQAELKAEYSALSGASGTVFTLDPSQSTVRIYVFRGGRAAAVGHNHVLSAPQFVGFFYLPVTGAENGRFDLAFRLDQLEMDNPKYRSSLGSAFASILSPEAIKGAREHMLGVNNLQADKFPFVRVHSLQITGESPKFAAKVQIEMHGQQHAMWIPLTVEGLPEHLVVAGSFVLRQTDFGVQPYSVLGGFLAVQDAVVVEFKLLGDRGPP